MTRFEAAALLNACLDRITEVTDELKRLMAEFEKELAVLRGRVDGLEAWVGELEAAQFSTTTKLTGKASFSIGPIGDGVGDVPNTWANQACQTQGATAFNDDIQLNVDTSFTGKDLLRTRLRAGHSAQSPFGGPSVGLNASEAGFEVFCGTPNCGGIGNACSAQTGTAQIASTVSNWGIAAAYTDSSGGAGPYSGNGTPLATIFQTTATASVDGNYAWEWWSKFQVTDNINGNDFNNSGGFLKTTFKF